MSFSWWHEIYMPEEILCHFYKNRPQASVHMASSKFKLYNEASKTYSSAPQFSCIRSIEAEWDIGEYNGLTRRRSAGGYPDNLRAAVHRSERLENLMLVNTQNWRPVISGGGPYEWSEVQAKDQGDLISAKEENVLPQVKNIHFESIRFEPRQSALWAAQLQWQALKHLALICVDWAHLLPKITIPGCFQGSMRLKLWK
ncbi:unnamed protein product [Penicillium olsonii]|uniref:Uncharacterized protein n=1 Tax=Penicillium olsonii TaxID=99116 RepID=A0A9W4I0H0_PENOL|nr:unnamed protein product [Penicillium olsonii]CAG8179705.1 unnamed protein product [Penicillium olsonii]